MRERFAFFCCCVPIALWGQVDYVASLGLRYGEPSAQILSTRTVVIVMPVVAGALSYEDVWREDARKAHGMLRRAQIDAVMYVHGSDFFITPAITKAFVGLFEQRAARNVIFLTVVRKNEHLSYDFVFTALSGEGLLVRPGTEAFRVRGEKLDVLYHTLREHLYAEGVRSQNFLIPDVPEFYREVYFFSQKPKRTVPYDIKNTALAVSSFRYDNLSVSDDTAAGRALRAETEQLTTALNRTYPFPYEVVDFNGNEQGLYKKGYKYVLLYLRGSDSSIRRNFNYPFRPISQRRIPEEHPENHQMVYAFYIQRLHPKEIFVGNRWSASPSLEQAIENFLSDFTATE